MSLTEGLCLSVCFSVSLTVGLSVCLSLCMTLCLSVSLYVSLYVFLPLYIYLCPSLTCLQTFNKISTSSTGQLQSFKNASFKNYCPKEEVRVNILIKRISELYKQ
jgi:hypothetical protein